jgi:hypothetical protein
MQAIHMFFAGLHLQVLHLQSQEILRFTAQQLLEQATPACSTAIAPCSSLNIGQ